MHVEPIYEIIISRISPLLFFCGMWCHPTRDKTTWRTSTQTYKPFIYIYIHKQRARARIDTCDCDDRARVSVQGVSLQDVLYLGDDVLSTRALSVGGRVAPLPLQLQPAQLRVRQRQAHASLLPARTIHHPQDRRTSLITMGYSFIKIRSEWK